jgi:hypothetical protein
MEPNLNINITITRTANDTIYNVGDYPCSGKAQLKSKLMAECRVKVDEIVSGLYPDKVEKVSE